MTRLARTLLRAALACGLGALPVHAGTSPCTAPTIPGGGPAATDCIVAWGSVPALVTTCTDGDPGCDVDGTVDGVCTFGLQAFVNVAPCLPGPFVATVKPASSPVARALAAQLAPLAAGTGCTIPGLAVALKASVAGIKPGVAKLSVSASSAGGKPDRDKLRLTCQPGTTSPPFTAVQAVFTARCATPGCHDAVTRSSGLDLHEGVARANLIDVPATEAPKLALVSPGDTKHSYVARKLLGQGLPRSAPTRMPTNIPGGLPDTELFTILSWIANGAPAE